MLHNDSRRFVCEFSSLKAGEGQSIYQNALKDKILRIPVAHGEGRYYIDDDGLKRLQDDGMVAFRYVNEAGKPVAEANPNGSVGNIAGVVSKNGRVMGMMPHPERAADEILGGSRDGLDIMEAFFASFM